MNDLWKRLEAWAKKSGRTLRLRPGATEKAIADAEKKMKLTFPADFRASLLLHDGQERKAADDDSETSTLFEWMPGSGALAPLSAIVAQWKDERDNDEDDDEPAIEGGVYNVMTHPRRIPIAGTRWWDGDNTYLDLHPAPKGTAGQLITFTSECDVALLGTSFRAALESYVQALDAGDWVFDAKKGNVRAKNEKPDDFPHEGEEFAAYVKKHASGPKAAAPKKKPPAPKKKPPARR